MIKSENFTQNPLKSSQGESYFRLQTWPWCSRLINEPGGGWKIGSLYDCLFSIRLLIIIDWFGSVLWDRSCVVEGKNKRSEGTPRPCHCLLRTNAPVPHLVALFFYSVPRIDSGKRQNVQPHRTTCSVTKLIFHALRNRFLLRRISPYQRLFCIDSSNALDSNVCECWDKIWITGPLLDIRTTLKLGQANVCAPMVSD